MEKIKSIRLQSSLVGKVLDGLSRVMAGVVVAFCLLVVGMAVTSAIIPKAGLEASLDVISAEVFLPGTVWIAATAVAYAAGYFLRRRA